MKKIALAIISILLLISFSLGLTPETPANTILNIKQFKSWYVGTEALCITNPKELIKNERKLKQPQIEYRNILYNSEDRTIAFDAVISVDGEVIEFSAVGILYVSHKQDYGINSIVGQLADLSGRFKILRFEIYNDYDMSKMMGINTEGTAQEPVLLFYLQENELLYLFETPIPQEMRNIKIADSSDTRTNDVRTDGKWYLDFID